MLRLWMKDHNGAHGLCVLGNYSSNLVNTCVVLIVRASTNFRAIEKMDTFTNKLAKPCFLQAFQCCLTYVYFSSIDPHRNTEDAMWIVFESIRSTRTGMPVSNSLSITLL